MNSPATELVQIKNRIFMIRVAQLMIDRYLSVMNKFYTKVLNQTVKRNSTRFPSRYRFQLS